MFTSLVFLLVFQKTEFIKGNDTLAMYSNFDNSPFLLLEVFA